MTETTDAVGQALGIWQFQSCCDCDYITPHRITTGASWCLYCGSKERMHLSSIVIYEKSEEYLVE